MKFKNFTSIIIQTFIVALVLITSCHSSKKVGGQEIQNHENTEPKVLFVNLRFFNVEQPKVAIELISRNKGILKLPPPTQVDTRDGDYSCTFLDAKGNSVGQFSIHSPLEQYMEKSNEQGVLERILVKKEEEFIPLRVNDSGNITSLIVAQNIDGKIELMASFDVSQNRLK